MHFLIVKTIFAHRLLEAFEYSVWQCAKLSIGIGVRVPYCPGASAHPPILTVLWFFRVLRVTAHHAKLNPKVGLLSSHSCSCSDALWATRHQASKVRTHPSMASFAALFPCSTKFAYCKWRLNAAETWQRGYKLVSFVAWHSFLHYRAGLDKARTKRWCSTSWQLTSHPGWPLAWG